VKNWANRPDSRAAKYAPMTRRVWSAVIVAPVIP
jgi:hypothetical protein